MDRGLPRPRQAAGADRVRAPQAVPQRRAASHPPRPAAHRRRLRDHRAGQRPRRHRPHRVAGKNLRRTRLRHRGRSRRNARRFPQRAGRECGHPRLRRIRNLPPRDAVARRPRERTRRAMARAARGRLQSGIQNRESKIPLPFLRAVRPPKHRRRADHPERGRRRHAHHAAHQTVARRKNVARTFLGAPAPRILASRTLRAQLAHPAKAHPAILGARPRTASAPRRAAVAEHLVVGRAEDVFAKGARLRAEGQRLLARGVGQPRSHRRRRCPADRVGRRH